MQKHFEIVYTQGPPKVYVKSLSWNNYAGFKNTRSEQTSLLVEISSDVFEMSFYVQWILKITTVLVSSSQMLILW